MAKTAIHTLTTLSPTLTTHSAHNSVINNKLFNIFLETIIQSGGGIAKSLFMAKVK